MSSLKEAIEHSGLKSGMTISFHHHLRNGDQVLNMVLDVLSDMGLRDLTINASSIHDVHKPLLKHIQNGVVTGLETAYIGGEVGRGISEGLLQKPVKFRTHGGRSAALESGESHIDVAFLAVPAADKMGNCSGTIGPSACGSLGYAYSDAQYANKVIAITDYMVPYPLSNISLCEADVDYVVEVPKIGDPSGIVSGTTKITRDPVGLVIAQYAAKAIQASGLLKDGFSFQTGAGGASLAVSHYLKGIMQREQVQGSFVMGGVTKYQVDMLHSGCFRTLMDVQCFDMEAIQSLREDPNHIEVSARHYASPLAKSAIVDSLDVVILGATQIDTSFHVNVHTDSNGVIMGGSGGHSDAAAGAKISIIVAPLIRARLGVITDHVGTISTPGDTVDMLVTQRGIAVNPKRKDLKERLIAARIPVFEIQELKEIAERITGVPEPVRMTDRVVADVIYRDGTVIDHIYQTAG